MTPIVELLGVAKRYDDSTQNALTQVDLSVSRGDLLLLVGPSGSGKSTILNLLGGLDAPSAGEMKIHGRRVEIGAGSDPLAEYRSTTVGFVFQQFLLLPELSVAENVELPLLARPGHSRSARQDLVMQTITRLGIAELAARRPNQLSAGQRQRAALARAMVHGPELVLADEPTANLDSKTAHDVMMLIAELNQASGTAFVIASHDARTFDFAKALIVVEDGRLSAPQIRPTPAGRTISYDTSRC